MTDRPILSCSCSSSNRPRTRRRPRTRKRGSDGLLEYYVISESERLKLLPKRSIPHVHNVNRPNQ
jgi:hypothetical protein